MGATVQQITLQSETSLGRSAPVPFVASLKTERIRTIFPATESYDARSLYDIRTLTPSPSGRGIKGEGQMGASVFPVGDPDESGRFQGSSGSQPRRTRDLRKFHLPPSGFPGVPSTLKHTRSAPRRSLGGTRNRTEQNDFKILEYWTIAPEALTTTALQIVRFFWGAQTR